MVEKVLASTESGSHNDKDKWYLKYYEQLQHQQNMLQDVVRTSKYHRALTDHPQIFQDKLVLDVGAGSGILSFFSIQAGAAYCYAVEASKFALKLKKLVQNTQNGSPNEFYQDRICVVHDKIENVSFDMKVDVIVSEPIGVFLVHERMCESFIDARDKFLTRNGTMVPRSGTIHITPFSDWALWSDCMTRSRFWENNNFYGVDLSQMFADAIDENISMPVVGTFPPEALLKVRCGSEHFVDYMTVTQNELVEFTIPISWEIEATGLIHGIAGWFSLDLDPTGKRSSKYKLDTSPRDPITHWQQVRFLLRHPLAVNAGQRICGRMHLKATEGRSYIITADLRVDGTPEADNAWAQRTGTWMLENQYYYSSPSLTKPELAHPEFNGQYFADFSSRTS